MHEPAGLIETTLQNEAVVMGIPSQESTSRLVCQNHPRADACLSRLAVKSLDDSEDKSADLREQSSVVPEIGSQELREGENELPMGQSQ